MSENTRGFTGWWIPVELIRDHGLDWTMAALWAEIHALSKSEFGCIAGNEHFAKHLGVTERRIQQMFAVLKSKDLIEQTGFDGRVRTLCCKSVFEGGKSIVEVKSASGQGGSPLQGRGEINGKAPIERARVQKRQLEIQVEEKTPKAPLAVGTPLPRRRSIVQPSPEAKAMIRAFAGVFAQRFGRTYRPDPKEDVKAAHGLLARGLTVEDVAGAFEGAGRSRGWWSGKVTTLPELARKWNEVGAELAKGAGTGKASDGIGTAEEWVDSLREEPK